MRLKEPLFYRKVGVRLRGQLTQPRLVPLTQLVFPLESIIHFNPNDTTTVGPSAQDPTFTETKARIFIEHVTQLQSSEGNPRRTVLNPNVMMNEYRRKNRLFKPMRKDESLTINGRNILVVNYAMLSGLYRYVPSFKSEYYRWFNIASTFWANVKTIHERFNWNQYIDVHLPDHIPNFQDFKRLENGISQKSLEGVGTPAALNLYDIWLWLGDNRHASNLADLDEDALRRINLVFRVKGYFFVINLGVLDAWRKDKTDDEDDGVLAASALQRRFVNLLHGLRDLLSGVTDVAETAPEESTVRGEKDTSKTVAGNKASQKTPTSRQSSDPEDDEDLDDVDLAVDEDGDTLEALEIPELDDLVLPEPVSKPEIDLERLDDALDRAQELTLPSEVKNDVSVDEPAEEPSTEDVLLAHIEDRAYALQQLGLMSPKAYERALEEARSYQTIPNPFGEGTLADALEIKPEDLELPDVPEFPDRDTIVDKSMLRSKLKGVQRKYIKDVMHKDIANAVMGVQSQGVAVKNYQVETQRDAMNHYEIHTLTLKPVRGRQSTVRFRLPVVDEEGRFIVNGVKSKMRLQRADIPIRKVSPAQVALTSYYNKTFVDRSARRTNNLERWLHNRISAAGLDDTNDHITQVKFSNVFDQSVDVPRAYSMLAKRFRSFTVDGYNLFLDYAARTDYFKEKSIDVAEFEKGGMVVIGHKGRTPVLVDGNDTFYVQRGSDQDVLGSVYDVLGIPLAESPMEIAEMSVANKSIPVGFVMAYYMGLDKLIEYLGCDVSRHRRGERNIQGDDQYSLVFQDEVLVFSRLDKRASLILAGINRYHQVLKQHSVWDFNRRDVYYRLLSSVGLNVRYMREIEALFASWVDPITRGLLADMGEPTEFLPLLLRAVELLLTDQSPAEVDGAYMRYRGYERMAGAVYNELIRAAKTHNARVGTGDNVVDLNPYAVWKRITTDATVSIVEERNPLRDLREQEITTYRGDGGRSGQSMVERTRIYHDSDMGVVSESTVDSSDVGVIAYLSPDANINSLRGTTRRYDPKNDGMTKLFSTSTLLAPCAAHDDAKRINFIPIQQDQGVFCDGAQPTPLRTGYEQIIPQRVTDLYAAAAEHDGKVIEVTDRVIVVEYKNGDRKHVELGKRHGIGAGVIFPHVVKTDLKVGDKVKYGDIIAYNEKFFTPDIYNPGQVVLRSGILCHTALIDNIDTLEDGSVISDRVAKLLNTQTAEYRTIEVRFDQVVNNLVKVGDHVDLETILCTIEDPETADNDFFDDVTMDTLRKLSTAAPRAKMVGTVTKVECFYHGDFEDLSPSLQSIAKQSDLERKRQAKALGQPVFTGEVDDSFRIKGRALDPDTLAVRITIDHDMSASVGDKAVFGNQLKTVVSRVMSGKNVDQYGEPLDAIFGNISIDARIVHSPKLMGTTNTLLKVLSKHIAAVYRGEKDAKAK